MSNLLNFDQAAEKQKSQSQEKQASQVSKIKKTAVLKELTKPASIGKNPYKDTTVPPNLYDFLLPDGAFFGHFSDPYATLHFIDPKNGVRNGMYWLEEKLETNSFTEREIKLLDFLSRRRLATRKQIERVVLPQGISAESVKKFLRNMKNRGVICTFSWVSPLNDKRRKPIVYGLTRTGARAAEYLFHEPVRNEFIFYPTEFPRGKGPSMKSFFLDLIGNELYSELVRIDRLISWKRKPLIKLENGEIHHPQAEFEVIKDQNAIRKFWIETVRISDGWVSFVAKRFQDLKAAYDHVAEHNRPSRVIVIVDGDSRIQQLAPLAEEFLMDVPIIFTTDERLLQGLSKETFIKLNAERDGMTFTSIPFLQEGYIGMSASDYLTEQQLTLDEMELFME